MFDREFYLQAAVLLAAALASVFFAMWLVDVFTTANACGLGV